MNKYKLCPYCGTPLKVTNWNRKFCPNCGVVDEDKETEVNEIPSYLN